MAIIWCGWVLRQRTVTELEPLTSQLSLVAHKLVVGPTHARGGTLDLLMTDVPNLVEAVVVAPIGNSDHSSVSAVIKMAQAIPNVGVGKKVFLLHQINWNIVCGVIRDLPWHNICFAYDPVEVLNEHLSLLVLHYVPTKVIHVRMTKNPLV